MRNIVTLSDIPEDTHHWLKEEAKRQTEKTGRRVHIYQIALKAIEEYRVKVEAEVAAESERQQVPVTS